MVDQSDPIARLEARAAHQLVRPASYHPITAMFAQLVQQSVGDLVRAALQFAWEKKNDVG